MEIELILCVIAGAFVYLLFSLNDIYGKPEFDWNIFFKQNWLPTFTNLVCGLLIIWRKEDLSKWLPITGIIAIFIGFSGQVLLKKVFKIFDKDENTFIGLNK